MSKVQTKLDRKIAKNAERERSMKKVTILKHPADLEDSSIEIILEQKYSFENQNIRLTTKQAIDLHHELGKFLEQRFPQPQSFQGLPQSDYVPHEKQIDKKMDEAERERMKRTFQVNQ